MIKIKVTGVYQSLFDEQFRVVVLVSEEDQNLVLPILMHGFEADAINMALHNISVTRPLTYDFMLNVLQGGNVILEQVVVESLQENTFFAKAKFRNGDTPYTVDARPSMSSAITSGLVSFKRRR